MAAACIVKMLILLGSLVSSLVRCKTSHLEKIKIEVTTVPTHSDNRKTETKGKLPEVKITLPDAKPHEKQKQNKE